MAAAATDFGIDTDSLFEERPFIFLGLSNSSSSLVFSELLPFVRSLIGIVSEEPITREQLSYLLRLLCDDA